MNVTLEEMQRDLPKYLHQVKEGETLVVYEAGEPIAEMKPIPHAPNGKQRRPIGLTEGEFTVPDDFNEPWELVPQQPRPFGLYAGRINVPDDFDDPLPEDVLRTFE